MSRAICRDRLNPQRTRDIPNRLGMQVPPFDSQARVDVSRRSQADKKIPRRGRGYRG